MTDWSTIGLDPTDVLARMSDPELRKAGEKFFAGQRLDFDDGLALLATDDLNGLGRLALAERRRRYGEKAFYIANHHLNYTNVCVNGCKFCAFQRPQGHAEGYLLSPEEAAERIAAAEIDGLKEVHLVGAINPEPEFDYYLNLLRALAAARPGIKLKAFTAVEIDHIAAKAGLSIAECLARLQAAGLEAMPGGGAEVFSERVRKRLFPRKISGDRWLEIHAVAHELGLGTNATLLFGHLETLKERVEHLLTLRDLQDESGGFRAMIPLAFHPTNTELGRLPGPTGTDILKTIAACRLILDNFPHIKAYWVMLGPKLTQVALSFGADDLEGTIVKEKITHQAGARTAEGMSRSELEALIREAGYTPMERDTFHRAVEAA